MDDLVRVYNHLKAAMTLAETAKLPEFLVYLIAMAAKETERQMASASEVEAIKKHE